MLWSSVISGSSVEKPVEKVDNLRSGLRLAHGGPVLGLLAKQPLPGKVKTRLTPPLHPEEACALYRVALRETVARFAAGPAAMVLCWSGRQRWFAQTFPGVPLLPQGRGDLGERLGRVSAALFAAGYGPVAVAGTDTPDMPLPLIDSALAALATADAAVVPSRDGGYALLALRRRAPQLFTDIPWSTPDVLSATRVRAAAAGLRLATVGEWDDLDDLASLQRLATRSPECATTRYARAHLGKHLKATGG